MARKSIAVEIAGRKISHTFYEWLNAEVQSSWIDNTYLDDFITARKRLGLDYESNENWAAEKQEGHLNRLENQWWQPFIEEPEDDESSARILFSALMFVSGAYRTQCYVQANSPTEYDSRRKKAIGINLQQTVTEQLATILPTSGNFSHANIALRSYDGVSLEHCKDDVVHKVGETSLKKLVKRVGQGLDLGEEHSVSVEEMLKSQKAWIEFATDCVAFAAKIRRGDLAAVPFLEPKSISASPPPKVIYPLAT